MGWLPCLGNPDDADKMRLLLDNGPLAVGVDDLQGWVYRWDEKGDVSARPVPSINGN